MKNKFLLFFLLICNFYCFSQININISPIYSLRNGIINEYVFQDNKKLSQLEWQVKNTNYVGSALEFNIDNIPFNFFIKAQTALSSSSGKMYDSDWLTLTDVKHCYSISQNKVANGFIFESELQGIINLSKNLKLSPLINFTYDYYLFNAKNAVGWYGNYYIDEYNKPIEKTNPSDYVSWDSPEALKFPNPQSKLSPIDYERNNFYIWLGFNLNYNLMNKFNFTLGTKFSWFSYIYSFDTHYKYSGATYYLDVFSNFFSTLMVYSSVSYNVLPFLDFNIDFSFTKQALLKGEAYYNTRDKYGLYYPLNSNINSGADATYMILSLSFKIKVKN